MKDDGSTTGGCWIYCGVYADEVNQAAAASRARSRTRWRPSGAGRGRSTAGSSTTAPRPTPGQAVERAEEVRLVGRGAGRWTGEDVPDFEATKRPDYVPPDDARAQDAIGGADPFVMQSDGKAWLFAPKGVVDGPLPTHYEPGESPVDNPLYGVQSNPTKEEIRAPWNRTHRRTATSSRTRSPPTGSPSTTRRVDEPHAALPGGAAAEFFVEVSPQLAEERAGERRLGDGRDRPRGRGGACW